MQWGRGLPVVMGNTLFSLASFDDRLEDDDFDLIEENLGVKVKRGVSVFFVFVLGVLRKALEIISFGEEIDPEQFGELQRRKRCWYHAVEPRSEACQFQGWVMGPKEHHMHVLSSLPWLI